MAQDLSDCALIIHQVFDFRLLFQQPHGHHMVFRVKRLGYWCIPNVDCILIS